LTGRREAFELETVTLRGKKGVRWIKRFGLAGICLMVLAGAMMAWANHVAVEAGEGRLFDEAAEVPEMPVALVFGCNRLVGDRPNLYFKYRIEAAVALWEAGKVRCFLVSGDNHVKGYNEPEDMKTALVEAGVPAEKVACDYAGLRTLDSVVRAKEIFGVDRVIFVSQRFHNERAVYLADANGLTARGLNARDVSGAAGRKTNYREWLARVKMWLDVKVLGTEPRFLGRQEKLPL
jgi:SanA protein